MITTPNVDLLKQLQEWYASRSNGDWEHTYGISISTLDNPGWSFKVDLVDTYLFDRTFDEVHVEGTDKNDWYVCKVRNHVFEAASGPDRLCDVIALFLEWARGK
jgi:hypothetical protein